MLFKRMLSTLLIFVLAIFPFTQSFTVNKEKGEVELKGVTKPKTPKKFAAPAFDAYYDFFQYYLFKKIKNVDKSYLPQLKKDLFDYLIKENKLSEEEKKIVVNVMDGEIFEKTFIQFFAQATQFGSKISDEYMLELVTYWLIKDDAERNVFWEIVDDFFQIMVPKLFELYKSVGTYNDLTPYHQLLDVLSVNDKLSYFDLNNTQTDNFIFDYINTEERLHFFSNINEKSLLPSFTSLASYNMVYQKYNKFNSQWFVDFFNNYDILNLYNKFNPIINEMNKKSKRQNFSHSNLDFFHIINDSLKKTHVYKGVINIDLNSEIDSFINEINEIHNIDGSLSYIDNKRRDIIKGTFGTNFILLSKLVGSDYLMNSVASLNVNDDYKEPGNEKVFWTGGSIKETGKYEGLVFDFWKPILNAEPNPIRIKDYSSRNTIITHSQFQIFSEATGYVLFRLLSIPVDIIQNNSSGQYNNIMNERVYEKNLKLKRRLGHDIIIPYSENLYQNYVIDLSRMNNMDFEIEINQQTKINIYYEIQNKFIKILNKKIEDDKLPTKYIEDIGGNILLYDEFDRIDSNEFLDNLQAANLKEEKFEREVYVKGTNSSFVQGEAKFKIKNGFDRLPLNFDNSNLKELFIYSMISIGVLIVIGISTLIIISVKKKR